MVICHSAHGKSIGDYKAVELHLLAKQVGDNELAHNRRRGVLRIAGVRVKGIKGEPYCLINSNIAAADFGSVSLVSVKTHSDGVPFGLAADYVQRLSIKDADGSETFKDLDLPGESLMFDSAEIRLV